MVHKGSLRSTRPVLVVLAWRETVPVRIENDFDPKTFGHSPVNLGFDLEQIATEMIFVESNSLNSPS